MIMTMGTRATASFETAAETEDEHRSGMFDRAFRRYVAAREARARAIVRQHLAHLSDQRLLDLGFEPDEIRRVRSYAETAPYYLGLSAVRRQSS
jgi:uncharacterized protein YjiS (DUF1127 family)